MPLFKPIINEHGVEFSHHVVIAYSINRMISDEYRAEGFDARATVQIGSYLSEQHATGDALVNGQRALPLVQTVELMLKKGEDSSLKGIYRKVCAPAPVRTKEELVPYTDEKGVVMSKAVVVEYPAGPISPFENATNPRAKGQE